MPLQIRRGTAAELAAITPAAGEPVYTTDTQKVYIGDGSTAGGIEVGGGGGFLPSRPFAKPPAGHYLTNALTSGNLQTTLLAQWRIFWVPFVAGKDWNINSIGVSVTTAVAASNCRVGVYASDNDGIPTGSPLLGTADFDCSSTGFKEDTGVSLSMTAGTQYWLAVHASHTGIGVRAVNYSSLPCLFLNPTTTSPLVGFYSNLIPYQDGLPTLPIASFIPYNYYLPIAYLGVA
jgi:hypothetical protein